MTLVHDGADAQVQAPQLPSAADEPRRGEEPNAADEQPQAFLNLTDVEQRARELLDEPTYAFIAEGAGDERTLARNRDAFSEWSLLPRVLVDVSNIDPATEILGEAISMPVLVAPMGMQSLVHADGECATARAAAEAGTIMCISTVSSRDPAEIAACGAKCWYQLYSFRDEGLTDALIDQARDAGCTAIVLTVDGPVIGRRERARRAQFAFPPNLKVPSCGPALGVSGGVGPALLHGRIDPALTWRSLERIASRARLPLILKGVLSPADAELACEHGVAGLIVSNHGGRQLDRTPASIEALPAVLAAAAGRVPVLVDGGVRRGTDVLTALALGASAVLVGRPVFWGLAVQGSSGVRRVLELLREEIESALTLLGCRTPAEVTAEHLFARAPAGGVRP